MNVLNKIKKYLFIIGFIFVLYIFRYITIRTPLAGDDWGYCLIGENTSVISSALSFYYTWSGRLFCELWGFTMATYRDIWNYINPILFSIIYICIYIISGEKKKDIVSFALIIAMMLTVFFQIRTQTYTWIAGGNYSVSLCLSLIYFLLIDILLNRKLPKLGVIITSVISNVILLIIGLMIESISLTMIIGIIILMIYTYKNNNKTIFKMLIINLIISIVGFLITRLSPGSAFRLARDHSDWVSLSIIEKIASGYHFFIEYSFINNTYTILFFSIALLGLIWFSKNINNNLYSKLITSFIILFGIFSVFSYKVFGLSVFNNPKSIFSFIFWPLYVINAFYVLFMYMPNGVNKDKSIFFLLIGGISAAVMIMSPVNGARAYVYLVYYLILVTIIIINSFDCSYYMDIIFLLGLLLIIYSKTNYYKELYDSIEYAQEQRLIEIKYYIEHPEDEEVWIKRFPENALHSIDIEEGDDYHFRTFKKYYNLPQNAENIVFYFDKNSNN